MEKIVVIKDVIGTSEAILHTFGMEVATEIKEHLKNGHKVRVDFKGTKNVNISFTQYMIHPVYKAFPKEGRENVRFVNLPNKFAKYELNEAISLENDPEKAKRIDKIRNQALSS